MIEHTNKNHGTKFYEDILKNVSKISIYVEKMCGLSHFFECGHIFRNGREQYLNSEENFK